MTALITRYGHALDIFLNGGIHNFQSRTVMPQVYHLNTGVLEYSAHNVDRGIVTVKKRCCRNGPYVVFGFIYVNFSTHTPSLLYKQTQDKLGLKCDIILNTVMTGQKPASKSPHVAQDGNIVGEEFHEAFIQMRQITG